MPTSPTLGERRARVAALARHRAPNDPELAAARQKLAVERPVEHVTRAVSQAPPLTPEQWHRLSVLLAVRTGAA